jgi:hypothetical protein
MPVLRDLDGSVSFVRLLNPNFIKPGIAVAQWWITHRGYAVSREVPLCLS